MFALILVCLSLGCGSQLEPVSPAPEPDAGDAAAAAGASARAGSTTDPCSDGMVGGSETDVDCGGDCDGCNVGLSCLVESDCVDGTCQEGACFAAAPGCTEAGVQFGPGDNWHDSYSVGDRCYCASTFDHNIGSLQVETPAGLKTVREVCEAIGSGPGTGDNPVYNDIQCGNGPANDAGDEDWCPGRVDQGKSGCCTIGPKWDLSVFD